MDNNIFTASPISGFGSKYRACIDAKLHLYLPHFTHSKQIYVEPFCFSCTVFFNTNCKVAVLNDKNDYIYNFWHVVKEKYAELQKEWEYVWVGAKWIAEYAQRTDPVGKAVFFYLMNRSSPAGIYKTSYQYMYYSNTLHKDLTRWKDRFDHMTSLSIWDLDFREVYARLIKRGGEQREFVWYIDPPYYDIDNKLNLNNYRFNFIQQDHIDLYNYHTQMKDNPTHHVLISYNDHPFIRKLYADWYIKELQYSTGVSNKAKADNHELIISNRPLIQRVIGKYQTRSLDTILQKKT